MAKFIALYRAPVSVLDDWMKTDESTRKEAEEKMKQEWDSWMEKVSGKVLETNGTGKVKKVSGEGMSDDRNDIMLYSIVEAESQEEAASLFEGHPHLQIPQASIEVMPTRAI